MLLQEDKKELEKQAEFDFIIQDLVSNETVQKMKLYKQHYDTSCFEHCKNVAYYSYLLCKKYHLDYVSVARAGMLHDLFLYDWRLRQDGRKGLHAFTHPKTALTNATKLFTLNKKEKDIILKHMWPVTFFHFPKYKESYIITLVDKYCAIQESINAYRSKSSIQKLYRYAYVFLSMLIILR
ncbi:MAG: HD family phosphohydrolase [Clostridia bacterium]|nr:HD family phosphohydrolase [Clostridia bacterium]